jgi:hypothetical protein
MKKQGVVGFRDRRLASTVAMRATKVGKVAATSDQIKESKGPKPEAKWQRRIIMQRVAGNRGGGPA